MKPVNEREAQYLWSQKSKRYKKRYFDALTELYQGSTNKQPSNAVNSTDNEQSKPIQVLPYMN